MIDPGPLTFSIVGVLVGLGMAIASAAYSRFAVPTQRSRVRIFGIVGVVAGWMYAATWASLGGRTFFLADAPRIAALVVADIAFVVWILVTATAVGRKRPAALLSAGLLLALRAGLELQYLGSVLYPPPPTPPQRFTGLLVGLLVLAGWVVLALWEIGLGRWLLRRVAPASSPRNASHA